MTSPATTSSTTAPIRVATPPGGVSISSPALPVGRLVPIDPPSSLAQKVVRAIVAVIAALAVGAVVYVLRFLITPVALAVLSFYVLNPLVNLMENRRVPRGIAVAICFVGLIGLLVALGVALWPSLDAWLAQKPKPGEQSEFELQLAARLSAWEAKGEHTYPQIDWHSIFDNVRQVLDSNRRRLVEGLPSMLANVASSAGTFLLAPIIALFLLLDGAAMNKAVMSLVPNRYFETVLLLIHRVDRQIAYYLRGAASESAAVAVLLTLVLWLAGMPNALLFGVLFGVLNVIPLVGPVIGASAGLLYSLMDPTAPSLGVLGGAYGFVYVVDAMLINPLVVGKNLNLHPLTIIVGISVGGALGGILGMLVSIPLIAIGKAVSGTIWTAYRQHRQHRMAA